MRSLGKGVRKRGMNSSGKERAGEERKVKGKVKEKLSEVRRDGGNGDRIGKRGKKEKEKKERKDSRRGSERVGTQREAWKKGKAGKEKRDGKRGSEIVGSQWTRTVPGTY